jgi:sulfite reductase (ferredoxin)
MSKSKVEVVKEESHYLRGAIAADLGADTSHFDESGKQVLKFHGLYQQDDRDQRTAPRQRAYSFMVRSRIPGGQLTAEQYLAHDDLADRYANGTLRITTRQDFQLHGVLKGDLKVTLQGINDVLLTTLGACGDLVRNVMGCPIPSADPVHEEIQAIARRLSDHLSPRTRAYHEIWLEGEKVYSGAPDSTVEEPLYGRAYLPRKFKMGIAAPGDNCIDVYTQDVGLVAIVQDGELVGFNLLVGGGMGMTHNKPETFPRLADPLAFITPDEVVKVVEQIVCIHRDFGDRCNRKHARLKYIVHEWGPDKFRLALEQRLGYALLPLATMPSLDLKLHLGWHEEGRHGANGHHLANGRYLDGDRPYYLGLSVENGRIQDLGEQRLKSGLRHIIAAFRPGVRLTPNQDILLTGLRPAQIPAVNALLAQYGIRRETQLSNVRRHALACPALPTCSLALAEAERALPAVLDHLERELAALDLADERLTVRMTGCPNGCARPYVADLAFVGRSGDKYVIYVGGRSDGTRLNQIYADLVPLNELVETVRPLLVTYKEARQPGESFGDFCARVGTASLHAWAGDLAREGVYA